MTLTATDLEQTCEELLNLPSPVLDLTSEKQVLHSLLDLAEVFREVEPELVSPLCLMILRELGRLPGRRRDQWIRSVLSIAPIKDETILRTILEKKSIDELLRWMLENPEQESALLTKHLESLFKSIPYHNIPELLKFFRKLQGVHKDLVKSATPTIRSRIVSSVRSRIKKATAQDAEDLIKSLHIVGGKQIVPFIKELLLKISSDNISCIKTALETLRDTNDNSFVPYLSKYLDHKDSSTRKFTVDLISGLGGLNSIELLKAQVRKKDIEIEEKKHVISSIANVDSNKAEQTLKGFSRIPPFGLQETELRQYANKLLKDQAKEKQGKTK